MPRRSIKQKYRQWRKNSFRQQRPLMMPLKSRCDCSKSSLQMNARGMSLQEARKVSHDAREAVTHLTAAKEAYTARYEQFRKMLAVSRREIPLSSIVDDIERVTVADGKRITVKWA